MSASIHEETSAYQLKTSTWQHNSVDLRVATITVSAPLLLTAVVWTLALLVDLVNKSRIKLVFERMRMKRSRMHWIFQLMCCLLSASARARSSSIHLALRFPRGGSEYELNPDYVPPPPRSITRHRQLNLGDLESRQRELPSQQIYIERTQYSTGPTPLEQLMMYTSELHRTSPTLSVGSLSCILVWLLWQRPQTHRMLQNNFVCSRYNVRHGRHFTTLLSALSHASFTHLLVNLCAFLSFGPSLVRTLSTSNWPLWPFVVGAAFFASHAFLLAGGRGGCMGLSGVTLAFLAFDAKCHPHQELGMALMGIIPVRMPAQLALYCILLWSLIGSIVRKSRVAHAAHLGGLLFGMGYYELWIRRAMLRRIRCMPMALLRRGQVPAR